jgi:hypothetical protein
MNWVSLRWRFSFPKMKGIPPLKQKDVGINYIFGEINLFPL